MKCVSYSIAILSCLLFLTNDPYAQKQDTLFHLFSDKEEKSKLTNYKQPLLTDFVDGFEFGSWANFYSLNEIIRELDSMKIMYPNIITEKDSIGNSIENRAIWAVKISDNPDINENEPEIFYNSLIHGVEPLSMSVLIYFMYYLLENYGQNPEVTYLIDNRELYFIPVVNPDGYVYGKPQSNGYRKNRRDNGDGTFGIDLNRNFGYMWGYNDIGSSPLTNHIMYRGATAFSEPEALVIRDFCNNHEFIIANNMHFYGYWMYYPWGYDLTNNQDSTKFKILGKMCTETNGYIPKLAFNQANGTVADWMYGEQITKPKIFAFTTETGGPEISNIINPTQADIIQAVEENVYLNKILAWGPGIFDEIPFISNTFTNTSYIKPLEDSLHIYSYEYNNNSLISNLVIAQILDTSGTLVDSVFLYDTTNVALYNKQGVYVAVDESFYELKFEHIGNELPFKFFYKDHQNLKFTSTGPIKVYTYNVEPTSSNSFRFKLKVTNLGTSQAVENIQIDIFAADSSISNIYPQSITFNQINPGDTLINFGYINVNVDDTFDGGFDFDFDIYSNEYMYWHDSIRNVVVDIFNPAHHLPYNSNLIQNYPNPFNSSTTISYSIPKLSLVKLGIYDLRGREVQILVDEEKSPGSYKMEFNAHDLSTGVYLYRLTAGDYTETLKFLLIK